MIVIKDIEQGTPEWHQLRAGIPTGSMIDKIITPSKKTLSAQAAGYMETLIAEYTSGESADEDGYESFWMARGKELEPEARAAFKLITGNTVEEVTFVYKDDERLVGCSPDGLVVNADGEYIAGVELKCPKKVNHVKHLLRADVPTQWIGQIQMSLWVTGLPRWYFMSYHPDCNEFLVEVTAVDEWQEAFDTHLVKFIREMRDNREDPVVQQLRAELLGE